MTAMRSNVLCSAIRLPLPLRWDSSPTQTFYTFDAKYNDASSALYIPAHISEQAIAKVQENAIRVYTALGCRGLSRVDFFCTRAGEEIVFNEINTIPGFTSISMYPKLFEYGGTRLTVHSLTA